MDATEVAVRDMCEQVMQELENIKTDMDTSFALVESVLATDEIKTARSLAETKWSEDVDNVILAANATNALKWYQQYLSDAMNGASQDTLDNDYEQLIFAFSSMYPGSIPIDKNNVASLEKLMFENGNMNKAFENLITSLASRLTFDSLTSG